MKKFEQMLAAANTMVDICLNGKGLTQSTTISGRANGTLAIDEDSIFVPVEEMVYVTLTPAKEDKVWIANGEVQTALTKAEAPSVDGLFEQMRDLLFAGWAHDGVNSFNELMSLISKTQGQIAKSDLLFKKELAKKFGKMVTADGQARRAWKSFRKMQRDKEAQEKTYALYKEVQKSVLGF